MPLDAAPSWLPPANRLPRGEVHARYLVDATGQDRLLARKARAVVPYKRFGKAAVFTHFDGLSRDALDEIGLTAYFPMPTDARALPAAWVEPRRRVAGLAKHGKPIVFTEAGYPSVVGATRQPWKWPSGSEQIDDALQARAYDALMRVCTAGAWCRGVFWWKYYEMPERGTSHAHDYSPRGKPAEAVLRRWYTTPAP